MWERYSINSNQYIKNINNETYYLQFSNVSNNTLINKNNNFTSIENITNNKMKIYYNLSTSNSNNTASSDVQTIDKSCINFFVYFNNTFTDYLLELNGLLI